MQLDLTVMHAALMTLAHRRALMGTGEVAGAAMAVWALQWLRWVALRWRAWHLWEGRLHSSHTTHHTTSHNSVTPP